jgi:hypothetical protein
MNSKSLCQSPFRTPIQSNGHCSETVVADRPQAVIDAWPRGVNRTPAVAPPVSPPSLQGHDDAPELPPFPLPPSFGFDTEKLSRHCHLHSGELVRAHHRTAAHQNSFTTPPTSPLPPSLVA